MEDQLNNGEKLEQLILIGITTDNRYVVRTAMPSSIITYGTLALVLQSLIIQDLGYKRIEGVVLN